MNLINPSPTQVLDQNAVIEHVVAQEPETEVINSVGPRKSIEDLATTSGVEMVVAASEKRIDSFCFF